MVGKETGKHVEDYLQKYKENPSFIETDDQTAKAIRQQIGKKIPLPGYARLKLAMRRKVNQQVIVNRVTSKDKPSEVSFFGDSQYKSKLKLD